MFLKIFRALFLLLLINTPSLFAAPEVIMKYYDVDGSSLKQMQKSMKKNSRQDGYKSYGHTHWSLKWSYHSRSMMGVCVVEGVKTQLIIEHRMPRWIRRDTADPDLVEKWDRFYNALMVHEEGHGNTGRQAEQEVLQTLPKLGVGKPCGDFKVMAKEEMTRILTKYQQADRDYDKKTGFGRTQGAVFPPQR